MEIPIKSILLTVPIINAVKQLSTDPSLMSGMKRLPIDREQGFPLSRLEENKNRSLESMPPISVKKFGNTDYYTVEDGRHRFVFSILNRKETIPATIVGGGYFPKRYFSGLSKRRKTLRKREIEKRSKLSWKNPSAYKPFLTDKGVKTRRSKYTIEWSLKFPKSKSLSSYSKVTGVPLKYLVKVFNRGKAAWIHGHRVGASAEQWGYARVKSFLLKGKTYYFTDSDLVKDAKNTSHSALNWWSKQPNRTYRRKAVLLR